MRQNGKGEEHKEEHNYFLMKKYLYLSIHNIIIMP